MQKRVVLKTPDDLLVPTPTLAKASMATAKRKHLSSVMQTPATTANEMNWAHFDAALQNAVDSLQPRGYAQPGLWPVGTAADNQVAQLGMALHQSMSSLASPDRLCDSALRVAI